MRNAAFRCIRRRASFALLAFVAFAATVGAPSADSASKKVLSSTAAITVMQATGASLSISWYRVRSAAGYDTYLDGARVAKTQGTAYTFANLRCGATYTLGVDAFTIKGVSSSIVSVVAGTSACPAAVGGNDTSPPTLPTSLTQGATTATTISLLWSASLDNVGVAGYDLFLNGNKVGTTTATSYSFGNLSCGTSYTLAVDAYDAAGNRSQSVAVGAATSACAPSGPVGPTVNCDIIANPGVGTLNAVIRTAAAGKTVCLHGGRYSDPDASGRVALFNTVSGTASAPITVRSYPGELATLCGYIETVPGSSYITVSQVLIDGSCTTQQKLQIFGGHFTLSYSEVDGHQAGSGSSCVFLGGAGFGTAASPTIDHDRLHGCGTTQYGHGIYDNDTSGAVITNNTIYDNGGMGIQFYPSAQGGLFAGNIVDGNPHGGIIFASESGSPPSSNNTVRDNIIANNGYYGINTSWGGGPGTGNVASHNCFFANQPANESSQVGWTDQGNNIVADPLYTGRANYDYTLQPGSSCAGMGPN
jgi:parallel beta-helix repeat protein